MGRLHQKELDLGHLETPPVFLKGGWVVSHLKPQVEMRWLEWEVVINLVINLK